MTAGRSAFCFPSAGCSGHSRSAKTKKKSKEKFRCLTRKLLISTGKSRTTPMATRKAMPCPGLLRETSREPRAASRVQCLRPVEDGDPDLLEILQRDPSLFDARSAKHWEVSRKPRAAAGHLLRVIGGQWMCGAPRNYKTKGTCSAPSAANFPPRGLSGACQVCRAPSARI